VYGAGEPLFVTVCNDKMVEQCQVYGNIYIGECKYLVLLTYEKPVALEFIPGIVCGEKFELYCFLVKSTKNLTFVNINVTIYLALHNNFVFTDGDKKRLACTVHKHLLTNKYLVVLLTSNTVT